MDVWAPSSFRDATSRVRLHPHRIERWLSPQAADVWRAIEACGLLKRLELEGVIVESSVGGHGPDGELWLTHPRLPVVSYSFEWPFAMLRAAGLAQLRLLRLLLEEGFVLRDGNPDNTLFVGPRPVFVDVGSIGRYEDDHGLPGLDQFCRRVLYPLLLQSATGAPFQALLRGCGPRGVGAAALSGLMGRRRWYSTVALRHVVLKHHLDEWTASSNPASTLKVPRAAALQAVRRLTKDLSALTRPPSRTVWTTYDRTDSYRDNALAAKERVVREWLAKEAHGKVVWDLGCNDGHFSRIAAQHASLVLAIDADEAVIDALYDRCASEGVGNVYPLVSDLLHPSVGGGWGGREYLSLQERGPADMVLALALWHHLVLGGQVPPSLVLAWLSELGRVCILEYVSADDHRARTLSGRLGPGHHALPDQASFLNLLTPHFDVLDSATLSATRVLYALRARRGAVVES